MTSPLYTSEKEILEIAKSTSGHRIADYNINNRPLSKNNKGVIGQIIEEGVFHYPVNSRAEADFANLGVELKVTGLKKLQNKKYVMKERLVLNIINYMEEYNIPFEDSSFWKKNKKILLMFYLYEPNRDDFNFMLIDSFIHEFDEKDLAIIKNDWSIIENKINNGEAHTISEGDTLYLGACTKGADAESSYREQPNSNIKARQRAFSLKPKYMNYIINKYLLGQKCESILSLEDIKNSTFEIAINAKLKQYFGMAEKELFKLFNINSNLKNKFNYLLSAMLGLKGKNINNTEEFMKANILLKTIRVEENGNIKEHMSFPTFKYNDIVNQEFEDSDLYQMLSTSKFMFVVFKKKNDEYHFDKIVFWNMPMQILNKEIKDTFEETKKVIQNGKIIKEVKTNGSFKTNFPGSTFNHVCHVRPHDQVGIKKSGLGYPLPVPDIVTGLTNYTKHCFWLDKNYIKNIIK